MEMIKLTIDNREVEVEKGTTILTAARQLGIEIPTLCHLNLPHLSHSDQPASCRICVVEVEGARNLIPSCATKVTNGMIVKSRTEQVVEARKTILDLLFSNHPEDCLTCEKAGDCSLQNYCYEYGVERSTYKGHRSAHAIDDLSPFIQIDKNKCILCGRCVTACSKLAVNNVLGRGHRGIETKIICDDDVQMGDSTCVQCGQCVQVCPVGALTDKKSINKARTWKLKKVRTTCPYCGVGCQQELHLKGEEIVRIRAVEDAQPNFGRLCVKGRYGYDFIYSPDRLTTPLIKENGQFRPASWNEAFTLISTKFKQIIATDGPSAIAGVSCARSINEDSYNMQKLFRAVLKTNNVDHCART